tara:strand:+ start:8216 stop:12475 length:4260 start_codon:yes stop_codon:yes gene_type:complete
MAEIKNSFQGSKMNQDLDDRLIPNGTYRSGTNIQVSNSESDDVGTLQTVLGNFELTDFGIPSNIPNLEVIGQAIDESKDLIIVFISNSAEEGALSEDRTGSITLPNGSTVNNVTRSVGKNFICAYSPGFIGILVQGSFLKFSKLYRITANIIEDLLFFTDNFNQPRKINIKNAISNSTYYSNEDQISIAKYYPYQPISFIHNYKGYKKISLTNKQDEYLPPSFLAYGQILTSSNPDLLLLKNGLSASQINLFSHMQLANNEDDDIGLGTTYINQGVGKRIKVNNLSVPGHKEVFVKKIDITTPGCEIELETRDDLHVTDINQQLPTWSTGHVFGFSWPNPDYDLTFSYSGQAKYLEDKFLRFSYRFKFDDDEYSLMAPFTQSAFIPKQQGYFIGRDAQLTARKGVIDIMENSVTNILLTIPLPGSNASTLKDNYKVKEIQIVSKAANDQNIKVITDLETKDFEGQVATATFTGGNVGSGFSPTGSAGDHGRESTTTGGSGSGLIVRVRRTGTLVNDYGALNSNFLEIVDSGIGYEVGDIVSLSGLAFQDPAPENRTVAKIVISTLGGEIQYDYNSQQPIKVLPEKEITRVSDIVPIKALAQAVVGNRVVYGNFLQRYGNLSKLDYDLAISDKNILSSTNQQIKEHPNHTVKQNRTYQIGVVLRDRYGRTSNVMLNDSLDEKSSTIYAPYTAGGTDPLEFFGRTLRIKWNREIPDEGPKDWPGLYHEKDNPLGWYTYQVVVKQKEQDYYNVYTAGSLSGNILFKGLGLNSSNLTFENDENVSHIALSGDNINKIPRELKQVGGNDQQFGSETNLFCVVGEPVIPTGNTSATNTTFQGQPKVSQQMLNPQRIQVDEIKTFRNLGDWTIYKGVDLNHLDANSAQFSATTFIYPGKSGSVDPIYLGENKNPYIAKLSTKSRIGFSNVVQKTNGYGSSDLEPQFSKNLTVFETSPTESALEIFYETGTSGLISELNNSIRTAEPSGVLTGISPIIFTMEEGDAAGTNATNVFEVMTGTTASNKINNPLSKITLSKVVDGNGADVTLDWQVVQATVGSSGTSPTFKIRNLKIYEFTDGSFDGNMVFTFTLKATCPDSEGTQVSKFFRYENFRVTNRKPIIYRLSVWSGLSNDTDVNTETGLAGAGYLQQNTGLIPPRNQSNVAIGSLGATPWSTYNSSNKIVNAYTASGTTTGAAGLVDSNGVQSLTGTSRLIFMKNSDLNQGNSSIGKYLDSNGDIRFGIGRLDFITNGSQGVTTFNSNTRTSNNLEGETSPGILGGDGRLKGLNTTIKSVNRYSVLFNPNNESYYFKSTTRYDGGANSPLNRKAQFKILQTSLHGFGNDRRNHSGGVNNGNPTHNEYLKSLYWDPSGESHIKDSDLGSNDGDNKAAWLFEITLQLEDAFDGSSNHGAGSKTSDDFIVHFIIHR